jgi:hypothetical protein
VLDCHATGVACRSRSGKSFRLETECGLVC